MSTRYSADDVRSIVKQIETEAKLAGLIPAESGLYYTPGNSSYSITGTVMCHSTAEDSKHQYIREADDFLPEFNYKMTRTDHGHLLSATLRVFHTFRKQREAVEQEETRRKMNYLAEHVARRSE